MARIILLMEFLVCGGLLWALGCAIAAKTKYSLLRIFFRLGWGIVLILPWVAACCVTLLMYINIDSCSATYLTICSTVSLIFMISISIISVLGHKNKSLMHTQAAALWPKLKLFKYSMGALLLTAATVWNYDINIRQSMTLMRLESQTQTLRLLPAKLPDSQNAATFYHIAYDLLDKNNNGFENWNNNVSDWLGTDEEDFDPENEQMLEFLKKNTQAIEYLHKAAALPGCYWENIPLHNIEAIVAELRLSKATARLLRLSSTVAIEQKRFSDAAKAISSIKALANHVCLYPQLIQGLSGLGIDSLAFESVKELLSNCPINSLQLDTLKINTLLSYNSIIQKCIQMDQLYGKATFIGPNMYDSNDKYATIFQSIPYRIFFWKDDIDCYLSMTDEYIKCSSIPYYKSYKKWNDLYNSKKGSRGVFAPALTPNFSPLLKIFAAAQAKHDLMIIAKSINQYASSEKRLPQNLSQLESHYIPILPVDPFSGEDYKLIQDDDTMTIYSVGSDMIDDSGSEFDWETKKGDIVLKLRKH